MAEQTKCELCGEPMPPGEEMFKYHGYSGPCPKPAGPCDCAELAAETARERIAQQLALWIQQGYTPMGETPLDAYGAEVLHEVIVWLRSREGE